VATLGLGGAALRLARKGGDEAVRVSKKAIKKSGRLAWRNPGKTSAAGAVGIETIDPGSVSGPLGDALDRTGDATANIAGEAGEGAAGAVAETVGQTLRETTKGLTEDWLGTAVLVAGGIVAALALTPLAEWVASELGEGST
jgi:O-acetyl-ADP-ribose deacetylase (regulator of RNase III)